MANRRRETEAERAQREREERIALLKMKQGIIEESELIPENEHVEKPQLRGFKRFANFFYHNKAFIFLGAFFAFVIIVLAVQLIMREKEDLYIIAVAFDEMSEIGWRTDDLERTLEMYCPDFDENGYVHVTVNFIDRTSPTISSQYDQAQAQKLTLEMMSATAQLMIADEELLTWFRGDGSSTPIDHKKYFVNQSELCSEDMLFDGVGVRMNRTDFAEEARWPECPDNVLFFVRAELNNGQGSVKTNARNRERAMIVLQNIVEGNIVNPPEEIE